MNEATNAAKYAAMNAAMNAAAEATTRSRLLRVGALRAIEQAAAKQWAPGTLMKRAGETAAREAMAMALERPGAVLVLVGPGNNGGDALVAARVLRERGVDVRVALLDEVSRFRGDAADAYARWRQVVGADADALITDPAAVIAHATLVIDGLFGIGFSRAPSGKARGWIALVNGARCPVLALDVPSGLDADTGHVADIAIEADRTITFIAAKPGLYTADGPDHCGEIVIESLGCGFPLAFDDDGLRDGNVESSQTGAINRPALFDTVLKPRRQNSHKGSFGSVLVIGGNDGMVGAALLASRMALQCGAGRVYVKLLASSAPTFDVVHPELMLREHLEDVEPTAVAIGPGLGHDDSALTMLDRWIATKSPIVIDADALNAIAAHLALFERLSGRAAQGLPPAVLTPHPLEAARLLGTDTATVQADRIKAATDLAKRTQSVVVLKGAGSVIADTSGAWVINTTGNPGLATGGTGDVLCGLVAGLLAQHLPPLDAARAAAWLHGTAADDLVARGIGPIGLSASELLPAVRAALNRVCSRLSFRTQ